MAEHSNIILTSNSSQNHTHLLPGQILATDEDAFERAPDTPVFRAGEFEHSDKNKKTGENQLIRSLTTMQT